MVWVRIFEENECFSICIEWTVEKSRAVDSHWSGNFTKWNSISHWRVCPRRRLRRTSRRLLFVFLCFFSDGLGFFCCNFVEIIDRIRIRSSSASDSRCVASAGRSRWIWYSRRNGRDAWLDNYARCVLVCVLVCVCVCVCVCVYGWHWNENIFLPHRRDAQWMFASSALIDDGDRRGRKKKSWNEKKKQTNETKRTPTTEPRGKRAKTIQKPVETR